MTCAHTALTCANCGADVSWKDTRIRELEAALTQAIEYVSLDSEVPDIVYEWEAVLESEPDSEGK